MSTGICCYCGEEDEMTEEHIVPKGLFVKDHRVVVPCCFECNNGKAKDDEYFRLVFAVLKESEDHPVAQKVLEKVKRSLNNPNQTGYQKMIKRSANNLLTTDENGQVLIKRTGLDVEINRVNEVIEYIVMGLFYLEKGYRLSDEYHVVGTFGKEDNYQGKQALDTFRKILSDKPWKEIGSNEIFKYRYSFASDSGSPQSIWEMKIYDGRSCIALIAKK
jgi:hypothetical protein